MRRIAQIGLVATACFLLLWPVATAAQQKQSCPEGRTATGECVNPLLASTMREIGVVFSQPRISRTAFPVLPSGDRRYRYPNQLIPDPLRATPSTGPSFF
jgi:hypothetical protein